MNTRRVTRRDFLKGTVTGAAGIALQGPAAMAAAAESAAATRSTVALARSA